MNPVFKIVIFLIRQFIRFVPFFLKFSILKIMKNLLNIFVAINLFCLNQGKGRHGSFDLMVMAFENDTGQAMISFRNCDEGLPQDQKIDSQQ